MRRLSTEDCKFQGTKKSLILILDDELYSMGQDPLEGELRYLSSSNTSVNKNDVNRLQKKGIATKREVGGCSRYNYEVRLGNRCKLPLNENMTLKVTWET